MIRKAVLLLAGLVLGSAQVWLGCSLLAENFLGAYLIFMGLGYCIGGGIYLALARTSISTELARQSDRSLAALVPGILLILVLLPLEYRYLPEVLPRGAAAQWLGLALLCLGFGLRLWTRFTLKSAYQGHLQVRAGQQIVTSGPYRWIRHPGYSGFLLQALGLAAGFSSLAGLLGVWLLVLAFQYRAQAEEKMLVAAYPEAYPAYMRHTGRFAPRVR